MVTNLQFNEDDQTITAEFTLGEHKRTISAGGLDFFKAILNWLISIGSRDSYSDVVGSYMAEVQKLFPSY